VYYPDTLVGTDSHTTMINGAGVVGWGVGGIEGEAAMLGQPVYFLTPDVVGVALTGQLREGCTATDLVLTVTQLLRSHKVVGKFVEFFGEGARTLSVPDRATLANMAPEYGATMGFFPVDDKTLAYLEGTGRSRAEVAALEAYFRAQDLFGVPLPGQVDYSQVVTLDLGSVVPSLAGPKRPQDRIDIGQVADQFETLLSRPAADNGFHQPAATLHTRHRVGKVTVGHGDVLIAAITSCTNTSNPGVLLAAGLLANALGLSSGSSTAQALIAAAPETAAERDRLRASNAAMAEALRVAGEALLAIKEALRCFGEQDSTGTYPLEYVCCPDGLKNIGERIDGTVKAITQVTSTEPQQAAQGVNRE
jgi:aconitase A